MVEMMGITCSFCAGSPAISDSNGTPTVNTKKPIIEGGDAQEAMSKGYPHYNAWKDWDEKWPDEL